VFLNGIQFSAFGIGQVDARGASVGEVLCSLSHTLLPFVRRLARRPGGRSPPDERPADLRRENQCKSRADEPPQNNPDSVDRHSGNPMARFARRNKVIETVPSITQKRWRSGSLGLQATSSCRLEPGAYSFSTPSADSERYRHAGRIDQRKSKSDICRTLALAASTIS